MIYQEASVVDKRSSTKTELDSGAGTAVDVAPGNNATAALNAVTICRLGAVHLPERPTTSHADSQQGKTSTLIPPSNSDPGVETALVNAAAVLTCGSPATEHRPFYPDFPVQVRDASEATLLVNAALHYLGDVVGARILPDYRPSPREPLPEDNSDLTELGLATEDDLERMVADLFAQATAFSAQDRADLAALRDHGPSRAPHVAVKENLAVLTVTFPGLDFSGS